MRKPVAIDNIVEFAKRNRISIDRSIAATGTMRIANIRKRVEKIKRKHYLDPYFVVALCSALEWDAKSKLHFSISGADLKVDEIKSFLGDVKLDISHLYSMRKHRFGPEDLVVSQFNVSTLEQYIATNNRALQIVSKTNHNIGWFIERHSK